MRTAVSLSQPHIPGGTLIVMTCGDFLRFNFGSTGIIGMVDAASLSSWMVLFLAMRPPSMFGRVSVRRGLWDSTAPGLGLESGVRNGVLGPLPVFAPRGCCIPGTPDMEPCVPRALCCCRGRFPAE